VNPDGRTGLRETIGRYLPEERNDK
jgi:hypothetical protein